MRCFPIALTDLDGFRIVRLELTEFVSSLEDSHIVEYIIGVLIELCGIPIPERSVKSLPDFTVVKVRLIAEEYLH